MESVSVIREAEKTNNSVFKRNQDSLRHIIIASDHPRRYKCTVCNKSFKSKSNCSYHKNCFNDSLKQFKCSICKRRFSTKSHYEYHMNSHEGLNPFSCLKCSKSFKTKNKLLRHEQVHSENRKIYPCHECKKKFLGKTSLRNHERSHTGEKPFNCYHCSKAFYEKKNLIHHINSHNQVKNYICEICGSSFVVKWNLELHRRTHFPVRSFKCPEADCSIICLQKRYLKRHMELHKTTSRYQCEVCNQEFSRKDNLRRHSLKHLEEQSNKKTVINEKLMQSDVSPKNQICSASVVKKTHDELPMLDNRENEKQMAENSINKNILPNDFISPRESVIKSVSATNFNNRVSVIKDGRKLLEIYRHEQEHFMHNIPQSLSSNSWNNTKHENKNNSYFEMNPNNRVEEFYPSDQVFLSCDNYVETSMVKHFPIPKKMIAASYIQGLYSGTDIQNSTNENSPITNSASSYFSICPKYCDNNLLDLSMKNHE